MDDIPINGGSMSELDRITTHIEGLDENMQGGIPQGHICLVAGASGACLLYTSPSPRDKRQSRMPSSA